MNGGKISKTLFERKGEVETIGEEKQLKVDEVRGME